MTETASTEPPIRYGNFTHRMLASIIDLSIVLMVALPVVELIISHFLPPVNTESLIAAVTPLYDKYHGLPGFAMFVAIVSDSSFLQAMREQHVFERTILENALQISFIALYIIPFWSRHSATPGKMLFRLEIQDAKTGARMSERQCITRFFAYFVSLLPLTLGFAWISLNDKHRGFHDYVAGTVVVIKRRKKRSLSSAHQSEGP